MANKDQLQKNCALKIEIRKIIYINKKYFGNKLYI